MTNVDLKSRMKQFKEIGLELSGNATHESTAIYTTVAAILDGDRDRIAECVKIGREVVEGLWTHETRAQYALATAFEMVRRDMVGYKTR